MANRAYFRRSRVKAALAMGTTIASVLSYPRLRESEHRYRRLVDLSPEAMSITVGGKFVYLNQASLELFGASSAEDLLGRHSLELTHPDDREITADRARRIS